MNCTLIGSPKGRGGHQVVATVHDGKCGEARGPHRGAFAPGTSRNADGAVDAVAESNGRNLSFDARKNDAAW